MILHLLTLATTVRYSFFCNYNCGMYKIFIRTKFSMLSEIFDNFSDEFLPDKVILSLEGTFEMLEISKSLRV